MLKKISKLFLGLVVCAGSACVTPTHASSAVSSGVILVYVQSTSPKGAKDEMVTIYNNSQTAIDISDWCLLNKASVAFACVSPPSHHAYFLLPHKYVVFTTQSFIDNGYGAPENISFIYAVTNQSSGSLVSSGDTVSLVNAHGEVQDSHYWSTSPPSGKVAARSLSSTVDIYETDPLLSWGYSVISDVPESSIDVREVSDAPEDSENTENPDESSEPDDPGDSENEVLSPLITELLANPKESDTDNEFVELYNPSSISPIDLSNFTLRVGQNLEKVYGFPLGTMLAPNEYRAFYNSDIRFTLLNSSSSVQLEHKGVGYGDAVAYSDPGEGRSYALIDGRWAYTESPTPGGANVLTVKSDSGGDEDGTAPLANNADTKPCASNQYRNPQTNRCRLVSTSIPNELKPCAHDQYRNLETNRCRSLASSEPTRAACKQGQERNPETNRCRTIVQMTDAEHGVKGAQTQVDDMGTKWYWWIGIAGVILIVVGYAAWEWRNELHGTWRALKLKVAQIKK